MATPVVFVHGLWLHASSWQPWMELFREAGYEPTAPGWPGIPDTIPEARQHPEQIPPAGTREVADHYAKIIGTLPAKPIVVGHSFGGLVVQNLLTRGLAAAAVAIDPAPIKGVLVLPPSALRMASIALRNPANRNRAVSLTREEFRWGFGNALTEPESNELYDRWSIPTPGRPLFEAAFAALVPNSPAKVDTRTDRGPLLLTAGLRDRTVPPAVVRSTRKLYHRSHGITDYREFTGRGHTLTVDSGWREVADTALAWLKERSVA
jgi:pimeloyl-ACP methyl ester carboxylesterase